MGGAFWLILIGVFVGAFLLGAFTERARAPRPSLHVTVRPSHDHGNVVQHMMSAQIRDRRDGDRVLDFLRVDMREAGWEERLAENVAEMKHRVRTLEAAGRIAAEV